jgi:hypothetical protein
VSAHNNGGEVVLALAISACYLGVLFAWAEEKIPCVRRVASRISGAVARIECVFGMHAYGYSPDHDMVLCFACGKIPPHQVKQ